MYENTGSRRRRETFVVFALTILFGCGIFCYALLIGGELFLSMLITAAVMAAVIGLHYLFWGRRLDHGVAARRRAARTWARRGSSLPNPLGPEPSRRSPFPPSPGDIPPSVN